MLTGAKTESEAHPAAGSRSVALGAYIPGVMFSVVLAMAANFISLGYGGPAILFSLLLGMAFNFVLLPSRAPELNPVENIWQYLRANWLSNHVFETYDAIIDAACEAWRKLTDQPETITSIGMREWAHVGQVV